MNAENFRDGSGYETVALSHGTSFRTYGPVSAPAIILVWCNLGSLTYQDYAAPFVAAGFRVVLCSVWAGFPIAACAVFNRPHARPACRADESFGD